MGDGGVDAVGVRGRRIGPAGAAIVRKFEVVDRAGEAGEAIGQRAAAWREAHRAGTGGVGADEQAEVCLLYTSDAADEVRRV